VVICKAVDGDRDYTPCKGANIRILIVGVLIRKDDKVDGLEDGRFYGGESVIESALKKVRICLDHL